MTQSDHHRRAASPGPATCRPASFLPDLDLIAACRIPVALAAGTDTIALAERADLRHDPFHRPCTAIAARLGAEFAEFPGGHLAPMELPASFAAGLRDVFGRL
jgi:hypothetical protein